MFFVIFILFFSQYFQANSIRCMTGVVAHSLGCTVNLDLDQPIPTNAELAPPAHKCMTDEADINAGIAILPGSCYAEVSVDYNKKTMAFQFVGLSPAASLISPYDDMFGLLNGIKSVVQYKINGNLETEELQMTTRIQCSTGDNCALDKLRRLISNLTVVDARKNIFNELKNFLNPSESDSSSPLVCADDEDEGIECKDDQNRCKFDRKKSGLEKTCATADPNDEFDLEYRFNVIQDMSDTGTDNSAKSFKCNYLCKTDLCNSDANFFRVDGILNALAMGSESKAASHTAAATAAASNTPSAQNSKRKSDGVSLHVSFYYRSMIIFFIFIQILSN